MARVVVENLSKSFRGPKREEIQAVRQIDLSVEDRELVVLVGPSGCGKSTLLRLIAGLEEASSGRILIGGKVVNDVAPKDRDLAMVFQNYALYPHLTVYDNLALGLKLRKFPRAEIEARVRETAELLGLSSLFERRPAALSGGERQRVAIGRALVRRPKVFLFDEPLSNLDAQMRVQMRAEIARLHARFESTMIYVTHDQAEAMTLGNRIGVMSRGTLQQVAEPLRLYRHPANRFVAGFIGSPPMNFFHGNILHRDSALFFQEQSRGESGHRTDAVLLLRLDEPLAPKLAPRAGQPIVLGIRPEDMIEAGSIGDADPREHENRVESVVELIEPLGAETHVHLSTRFHSFTARLDPGCRLKTGERTFVRFNLEKAHWFDPATEKALI